ncbi:MAG: TadE/TadG family type IV pilus assembly protein [Pseudomonadota bacterium]
MLRNKFRERISGLKHGKGLFLKDKKGVAAVEFALIVPILLLLFIGTLEISLAVAVDRKVSRISSSVADLITQGDSYNKAGLDQLTDIATRIMLPYGDVVQISVVAINIDSNGIPRVAWSYGRNGGAKPAPGTLFPVPTNIANPDTFLISSEVTTNHAPAFSFLTFDGSNLKFDDTAIPLGEQMFLRPRKGDDIDCSDC